MAKLSKLNLTDSEVEKFLPQLSSVVDFIGQLNEVDTNGVEPTSQTTGLTNVFRQDEVNVSSMLSQDEATSGTDSLHNGLFKVGAILEERTHK